MIRKFFTFIFVLLFGVFWFSYHRLYRYASYLTIGCVIISLPFPIIGILSYFLYGHISILDQVLEFFLDIGYFASQYGHLLISIAAAILYSIYGYTITLSSSKDIRSIFGILLISLFVALVVFVALSILFYIGMVIFLDKPSTLRYAFSISMELLSQDAFFKLNIPRLRVLSAIVNFLMQASVGFVIYKYLYKKMQKSV